MDKHGLGEGNDQGRTPEVTTEPRVPGNYDSSSRAVQRGERPPTEIDASGGDEACPSLPTGEGEWVENPCGKQPGIRRMLFRNVDCWGPAAKQYLDDLSQYDAVGFLETHSDADDTPGLLEYWASRGFKTVASPARPSAIAKKAGGAVMGVRKHHQSASFRHLAALEEQTIGASSCSTFTAGPVDFWDFTPMMWRLKARNLVAICTYFTSGDPHANKIKMALIGGFVCALKDVWVIAGDLNMTPAELYATGWLQEIGGVCMVPHNTDHTCFAGGARMIDYVIIPIGAQGFFKELKAIDDGRFATHMT